MPYALCPMPYARRVPHLSEKGYISLAKCHHPHVVEVYGVFSERVGNIQLGCMVMELIDGTNLAEYLEDNGLLFEAKALPMKAQDYPPRITRNAVEAIEVNPPAGQEAIHWRLLTTHRVVC